MTSRIEHVLLLLLAGALAACGEQRLVVGELEDGEAGVVEPFDAGPTWQGDGAPTGPLADALRVELRTPDGRAPTLGCGQSCVEVEVVVSGGRAPYTVRWQDNETNLRRTLCGAETAHALTVRDTEGGSLEFPEPAQSVSSTVTLHAEPCSEDAGGPDGAMPENPVGENPSGCYDVDWEFCSTTLHASVAADLNGLVMKAGERYELRASVTAVGSGRFSISSAALRCDKSEELFGVRFDNPGLTQEQQNAPLIEKVCLQPTQDTRSLTLEWAKDLLVTGNSGTQGGVICRGCSAP